MNKKFPLPPKEILFDLFLRACWRCVWLATRVFPARWTLALGDITGRLMFHCLPGWRVALEKDARELLGQAKNLSSAEYTAIARRALEIGVMRQAEFVVRGRMSPQIMEKMVQIQGLEHLDAALAKGKGVIMLTAHFGAFLRGPVALGSLGYKVNQLAGPPDIREDWKITQDIHHFREVDEKLIPITFIQNKGTLKACFRLLKQKELLFIAFDGRVAHDFEPVTFLGRTCWFSPGVFRMAEKCGVPILPCFTITPEKGVSRTIIEPPFEVRRDDTGKPDMKQAVQDFAALFERYVAEYPELFLMAYHRAGGLGNRTADFKGSLSA